MSDDIARLGLAVDSTQVDKANQLLDVFLKLAGKAAENIDKVDKSSTKASLAQRAFAAATSGVSGQLIAMSAGAGPVGTFLSALGPWGLAAAVGLGAVRSALQYVSDESQRMGAKAIELRSFQSATDLSIASIGALRKAGAEFGITGDTIQNSFIRVTAGLQDARRATGPLYEDVLKINAGLAKELTQATSTAEGIDVLAKAYRAAGDASARADLARSIFGRGGAELGPILGKVADAGGLANITSATKDLGNAADDTNQRWATMAAKIIETEKRTKNILASIFTEEGLRAELASVQLMERFAIATRDAASARKLLGATDGLVSDAAASGDPDFQIAALSRRVDSNSLADRASVLKSWADYDNALGSVMVTATRATTAIDGVTKSTKKLQDEAAAAARTQNDMVSFLGSAATIAERTKARLTQIESEYRDNRTGAATDAEAKLLKSRAEAGAALDALITRESLRLGVLGPLAQISEIVAQKQNEINKANAAGAGITPQQARAVREYTIAQQLGTLAIRQQTDAQIIESETIGKAVGATAAFRAEQERLADFRLRGIKLTQDQKDAIRAEAEALGVATQRAAERRALTDAQFESSQFGRDNVEQKVAQNLRSLYGNDFQNEQNGAIANQIRFNSILADTKSFSESALSGFLRDLRDGKSATESLGNVLIKLEDKLFDIASNKLLSSLIGGNGSLLSGLFGGTSPVSAGNIGGTGGVLGGLYDSGGFTGLGGKHEVAGLVHRGEYVIDSDTLNRMGGPRVLDRLRGYAAGGYVGDSVPVPASWSTPSAAAPGGNIFVTVNNAPAGSNPDVSTRRDAAGNAHVEVTLRRMIDDTTAQLIRSGDSNTHDAMRDRFNLNPSL